jgi:hypothetical protein
VDLKKGTKMKKTKAVRGFWSWLMGHGWERTGIGG